MIRLIQRQYTVRRENITFPSQHKALNCELQSIPKKQAKIIHTLKLYIICLEIRLKMLKSSKPMIMVG